MGSTLWNRRRFARAAVATVLVVGLAPGRVLAQDDEAPPGTSEVPTTGGRRPGPVVVGTPEALAKPRGAAPVAIWIDKAGVDAPVERGDIVDGVMQNPSGPWVVAWYDDLAAPGEGSNTVLAGHVDYWDVGPAVFWNLKDLVPGDTIRLTGEDGRVFEYAVEWSKLYDVATELTPQVIQEDITGPTTRESVTLITCGGPFDPTTGQYLQRLIVRATLTG